MKGQLSRLNSTSVCAAEWARYLVNYTADWTACCKVAEQHIQLAMAIAAAARGQPLIVVPLMEPRGLSELLLSPLWLPAHFPETSSRHRAVLTEALLIGPSFSELSLSCSHTSNLDTAAVGGGRWPPLLVEHWRVAQCKQTPVCLCSAPQPLRGAKSAQRLTGGVKAGGVAQRDLHVEHIILVISAGHLAQAGGAWVHTGSCNEGR